MQATGLKDKNTTFLLVVQKQTKTETFAEQELDSKQKQWEYRPKKDTTIWTCQRTEGNTDDKYT